MVFFCCPLWKADRWSNWSELAAIFCICSCHQHTQPYIFLLPLLSKTHLASQLKLLMHAFCYFYYRFFKVLLDSLWLCCLDGCLSQALGPPRWWSCWFRSGCKRPSHSQQQWGCLILQTIGQRSCAAPPPPPLITATHRHTNTLISR